MLNEGQRQVEFIMVGTTYGVDIDPTITDEDRKRERFFDLVSRTEAGFQLVRDFQQAYEQHVAYIESLASPNRLYGIAHGDSHVNSAGLMGARFEETKTFENLGRVLLEYQNGIHDTRYTLQDVKEGNDVHFMLYLHQSAWEHHTERGRNIPDDRSTISKLQDKLDLYHFVCLYSFTRFGQTDELNQKLKAKLIEILSKRRHIDLDPRIIQELQLDLEIVQKTLEKIPGVRVNGIDVRSDAKPAKTTEQPLRLAEKQPVRPSQRNPFDLIKNCAQKVWEILGQASG